MSAFLNERKVHWSTSEAERFTTCFVIVYPVCWKVNRLTRLLQVIWCGPWKSEQNVLQLLSYYCPHSVTKKPVFWSHNNHLNPQISRDESWHPPVTCFSITPNMSDCLKACYLAPEVRWIIPKWGKIWMRPLWYCEPPKGPAQGPK